MTTKNIRVNVPVSALCAESRINGIALILKLKISKIEPPKLLCVVPKSVRYPKLLKCLMPLNSNPAI